MRKDLFDHRWIFDARDHFHRTALYHFGRVIDVNSMIRTRTLNRRNLYP